MLFQEELTKGAGLTVWLIRTGTHKVGGSGKAEMGTTTIVHTTGVGPWRQSRCVRSETEWEEILQREEIQGYPNPRTIGQEGDNHKVFSWL